MNIFAIEGAGDAVDWRASARSQDNLRLNAMLRESCQMLSTALNLLAGRKVAPYKSTHAAHPATRWVSESSTNWICLADHCDALAEEYRIRFRRVHACEQVLEACADLFSEELFPKTQGTPLPLCMPDEFKGETVVDSYRRFYASKPRIRYPRDKVPTWFWEYRTLPFVLVE